MKVGDLIQYTTIGSGEIAFGIVVEDLGYVAEFGEGVSVYWFDSEVRTTENKNDLASGDSYREYEVISKGLDK